MVLITQRLKRGPSTLINAGHNYTINSVMRFDLRFNALLLFTLSTVTVSYIKVL